MADSNTPDRSYEWKAVTLLGLGFGLVGVSRWIIDPLFPFMIGLASSGRCPGMLLINCLKPSGR